MCGTGDAASVVKDREKRSAPPPVHLPTRESGTSQDCRWRHASGPRPCAPPDESGVSGGRVEKLLADVAQASHQRGRGGALAPGSSLPLEVAQCGRHVAVKQRQLIADAHVPERRRNVPHTPRQGKEANAHRVVDVELDNTKNCITSVEGAVQHSGTGCSSRLAYALPVVCRRNRRDGAHEVLVHGVVTVGDGAAVEHGPDAIKGEESLVFCRQQLSFQYPDLCFASAGVKHVHHAIWYNDAMTLC